MLWGVVLVAPARRDLGTTAERRPATALGCPSADDGQQGDATATDEPTTTTTEALPAYDGWVNPASSQPALGHQERSAT